jgi:serine/threonine protein kinase
VIASEVVFDPDLIFVVMEYCPHGDLFTHIVTSGVFAENRAREILSQIAEAVQYIHARGIAHRDLKPENILLDRQFVAKLADFGLCHVVSPKVLLRTPCGSPFYAPPEILANQDYDGKTADIWSLGVLLFTMVTGSLPWVSDNQARLFREIIDSDVDIPALLSPTLQDLLQGMLKRDPAERFTIADVIASAWLPKHGAGKGYMRAATWSTAAIVSPVAPAGPKRLLVRPKNKKIAATLTASSGLGAFSMGRRGSLTWE